MKTVDLNCDMGESFGRYTVGRDEEVIGMISSANIACGFHASDPVTMQKTVSLAAANGVAVGAHPGFCDLVGFGRRKMELSADEVRCLVMYQIGALRSFCMAHSVKLTHVKPHGALYNMAAADRKIAEAVVMALRGCASECALLAPGSSMMAREAEKHGVRLISEVFADRAYMSDGSLVPRTRADSMITDEELAVERVLEMICCGTVKPVDGGILHIKADSVCVHGDSERSVNFLRKIRKACAENHIEIKACRR